MSILSRYVAAKKKFEVWALKGVFLPFPSQAQNKKEDN